MKYLAIALLLALTGCVIEPGYGHRHDARPHVFIP